MSAADELKQIEELAELQFQTEQIALIVGIDQSKIDKEGCENHRAFMRGRLKAEAEVRKSIFLMAKQGSTPAQKQMLDIIEKNRVRKTSTKLPEPFDIGIDL